MKLKKNLVELNDCKRVFTWSAIKNLEHHAYWLNIEDKILLRENLELVKPTFLYNVKKKF
jgi:hypothetical protein